MEVLRSEFINTPKVGGRARVNELESTALAAIAAQEGVRVSEAIRLIIREGAIARGLWPPAMKQPLKDAEMKPCS